MFENLENTLLEINRELRLIRKFFELIFDNLRTKKQVARYLSVAQKPVYNWTKDGTFIEGIHFIIDEKGEKEYIPNGIIEFEEKRKNRKIEVITNNKFYSKMSKIDLNRLVDNNISNAIKY